MNTPQPPMVVDIPDVEFTHHFARVAILHAHLDNALAMYIRSFGGATVEDVMKEVGFTGSKRLREWVWALATKRLGKSEGLALLHSYLQRCKQLTNERNALLHNIIGRERDGTAFFMRKDDATWVELPKPAELKSLGDAINDLMQDMHHERLSGVIGLELSKPTK
jgi:hypothetical protein